MAFSRDNKDGDLIFAGRDKKNKGEIIFHATIFPSDFYRALEANIMYRGGNKLGIKVGEEWYIKIPNIGALLSKIKVLDLTVKTIQFQIIYDGFSGGSMKHRYIYQDIEFIEKVELVEDE